MKTKTIVLLAIGFVLAFISLGLANDSVLIRITGSALTIVAIILCYMAGRNQRIGTPAYHGNDVLRVGQHVEVRNIFESERFGRLVSVSTVIPPGGPYKYEDFLTFFLLNSHQKDGLVEGYRYVWNGTYLESAV